MKDLRVYFSAFLGIVILLTTFYVSQRIFFRPDAAVPRTPVRVTSSGDVPKFSQSVSSSASSANLTQQVISEIGSDFYTKTEGLSDQRIEDLYAQIRSGKTDGLVDPDEIVRKLSPQQIGVRLEISADEIAADPSGDIDAYRKKYLLAVTDVRLFIEAHDGADAFRKLVNEHDNTAIRELAEAHAHAYESLKDIPVPEKLRQFHEKNLLYFANSAAVYSAIAQYETDPLKGYVAAQYVDSLSSLWEEIYSSNAL